MTEIDIATIIIGFAIGVLTYIICMVVYTPRNVANLEEIVNKQQKEIEEGRKRERWLLDQLKKNP